MDTKTIFLKVSSIALSLMTLSFAFAPQNIINTNSLLTYSLIMGLLIITTSLSYLGSKKTNYTDKALKALFLLMLSLGTCRVLGFMIEANSHRLSMIYASLELVIAFLTYQIIQGNVMLKESFKEKSCKYLK